MAQNTTVRVVPPKVIEAQDSVTRPNDTTQYAEGDAISDNATTATAAGAFELVFDEAKGGGVTLTDFILHKSDHDATDATFWLLLFDAMPAVAGWEDNAASAITDAEHKNCKGVVIFPAASLVNGSTGDIYNISQTIGIVFASGSSTLWGILIAGDTYTPAAQEIFTLTAKGIAD